MKNEKVRKEDLYFCVFLKWHIFLFFFLTMERNICRARSLGEIWQIRCIAGTLDPSDCMQLRVKSVSIRNLNYSVTVPV